MSLPIVSLSEMTAGQEADLFAMMTLKEPLTTRDGKPYFRVGFRDAGREVQFPIWGDAAWADRCRDEWTPGVFYKLRAVYRETNFGPQLEIRKIREAIPDDAADGFDPHMLLPRTRFDPREMFDELLDIVRQRIESPPLKKLVLELLESNRSQWLTFPAARRNHHAFLGGLLEHVLSVTRTAVYLADKYDAYYPDMQPRLDKGLVVAGAVLHDVGKFRELECNPQGATYTPEGHLIGHILQGRDMVREAADRHDVDRETLLRLEHVIVSHQRLPEWGSPKPPMTPEAMLVHYADDLDAKYHMAASILQADRGEPSSAAVTSRKNILQQALFLGLPADKPPRQ